MLLCASSWHLTKLILFEQFTKISDSQNKIILKAIMSPIESIRNKASEKKYSPDGQNDISVIELEHNPNDEDKNSYKVYKRRWLILLVPLGSEILLGFRSWRFPITNIVYPFWDTTVDQATAWSILPLIINAILLIPSGRALDKLGVRRMVSC